MLYKYRFVILLTFVMATAANGFGQFGYSPIANVIKELYPITSLQITLIVIIYYACYVVFFFPYTYFIDKKGIGKPIIVAAALTLIGAWIRYLVVPTGKFYWVLVGSVFSAAG